MAGTVTLTVIPICHELGPHILVQCTAVNVMAPQMHSFDSQTCNTSN